MAQLPRQHAELSTMMCFVGNKVGEKVKEICRKVLPVGWRDRATASYAQSNQFNKALVAALQRPF